MDILAVRGSLSATSTNAALLRASVELAPAGARLHEAPDIGELPYFDPGLADDLPPTVERWSAAVFASDAVLIATPEYAFSLPGVLKNALDWLVGTGALHQRPVAVLSASTTNGGGANAQQAIGQTLRAHGAVVVATLEVAASRTKFADGRLVDDATREQLRRVLELMTQHVMERAAGA